jgi:hypothetical protein
MARLKANEEEMDRDEWKNLPEKQREELQNTFRHTGRTARYTNIMGLKTVSIQRERLLKTTSKMIIFIKSSLFLAYHS